MHKAIRWVPRWLLAIVWIAATTGCVYDPTYQGSHCGPGGACPDGYYCDPVDKVCQRGDEEADLEEPLPADGDDGAAGDDGGLQGDDGGSQGDDGGLQGDDGGLDGGDEQADGGDEQADGGDEQADGGDPEPCGGGCGPGLWCDPVGNNCRACEDTEHCGLDCAACDPNQSCDDLGPDGFCCLGPCAYDNACEQVDCNGHTYRCQAFFNPLSYSWIALDDAPVDFCALSDQDGIVAALYQCDPEDEQTLLYYCPWGGSCSQDGSCQADPAYAKSHSCGSMFGCDLDHCRMYLNVGQPCTFNFDCQSFCCSRDASATCLDGSEPGRCKIATAYYIEGFDGYTWHALPSGPQADPHDLANWWWEGGQHAAPCTADEQCDTGDCHNFIGISPDLCRLPTCLSDTEADTIRAHYFCNSPEGSQDEHIKVVTNQAPWPDVPADCIYQQ